LTLENRHDLEVARTSMDLTDSLAFADRYLHELSGGGKQRVMIARAGAGTGDSVWTSPRFPDLSIRFRCSSF
jgi:ABC-type cobalamin/Fe3+-siderophores transport system ATPase subunit